jgi:hypothetical protein
MILFSKTWRIKRNARTNRKAQLTMKMKMPGAMPGIARYLLVRMTDR